MARESPKKINVFVYEIYKKRTVWSSGTSVLYIYIYMMHGAKRLKTDRPR